MTTTKITESDTNERQRYSDAALHGGFEDAAAPDYPWLNGSQSALNPYRGSWCRALLSGDTLLAAYALTQTWMPPLDHLSIRVRASVDPGAMRMLYVEDSDKRRTGVLSMTAQAPFEADTWQLYVLELAAVVGINRSAISAFELAPANAVPWSADDFRLGITRNVPILRLGGSL